MNNTIRRESIRLMEETKDLSLQKETADDLIDKENLNTLNLSVIEKPRGKGLKNVLSENDMIIQSYDVFQKKKGLSIKKTIIASYLKKKKEIPDEEFLSEVFCLYLKGKKLNSLQFSFDTDLIRHLKLIDLSNNDIKDISFVKDFPCLENLNVSFNEIREVKGFAGCDKLVYLNLSYNALELIEDVSFRSLNELYLNCQRSDKLIVKRIDFKELKILEVNETVLDSYELFNKLNRLEKLQIESISLNTLEDLRLILLSLKKLRKLSFKGNKITKNYRSTDLSLYMPG